MPCQITESLQTLCLGSITQNFDGFCDKGVENENFLQYLDIIQKLYGDQLLKKLYQRNNVKTEYLKFLINKHTKELDLRYFVNCDPLVIESRIKTNASVITKFSVVGIKSFDIDVFLKPLSMVQCLILSYSNCTDRSLMIIAENCLELKELDLCGCFKVSDKGLKYLSERNSSLEIMDVHETSVTYKGVAQILKHILPLKNLVYNNVPRAIFEATGLNDFVDNCEERIFNLRNLVILNNAMRPENHLTAILKVCSKSCPYVKDLTVTEIVNEEQLNLCYTFRELKNVVLQLSSIVKPKLCINEFLELRGHAITSLSLTSFSVSVEILASYCPNLEHLSVCLPSFKGINTVNTCFSSLKVFFVQQANFSSVDTNSYAHIISSSPQLKELHIVSSECLENIADIILACSEKLTVLNLRNSLVTAEFIEQILNNFVNLENVIIENSGISSAEYDDLMDMVDDMGSNVHIAWADYSSAIRELYSGDFEMVFQNMRRQVLKL